jgi:hypothetical protein
LNILKPVNNIESSINGQSFLPNQFSRMSKLLLYVLLKYFIYSVEYPYDLSQREGNIQASPVSNSVDTITGLAKTIKLNRQGYL